MYHLQMKPIDTIIWDLETNGFVAPESKILEIGAFIIREGEPIEKRQWVLDNKIEISPEITAINGITNEIIAAEGRDPIECLNEFIPFLRSAKKNITHNGLKFDIPFLQNSLNEFQFYYPPDTLVSNLSDHLRSTAFDTAVHCKAQKLRMIPAYGEDYLTFADRVLNARQKGIHFNLGLSCTEHGIDTSKVTLHRALGDVEMTWELYKKIKNI